MTATKPDTLGLLCGAAPYLEIETPPPATGQESTSPAATKISGPLVVLQLHVPVLPATQTPSSRNASLGGAGACSAPPALLVTSPHTPPGLGPGAGPGAAGGMLAAAAVTACLQSMPLLGEPPAPLIRPPGPQVCSLPSTEGYVMLVEGFDQIWPPKRSPEDMLLYRWGHACTRLLCSQTSVCVGSFGRQ